MNNPVITVVMPAYNAQKYIAESIESVIKQTYSNWELIIVDDGSTDNTRSIAEQYQSKEERIKYFYQENGRQGRARNNAIKKSKGTFIAFLDADDLWVPEKLVIQLEEFNTDQNIDLIFSQGFQISNEGIHDYNITVKERWNKRDLATFIVCNQIPILSVLIKKEALLAVGSFTEFQEIQNVEDYHLWLKLLYNNFRFKSLNKRLFYYRIHPEQNTYKSLGIQVATLEMLLLFFNSSQLLMSEVNKSLIHRTKEMLFDDQLNDKAFNLIKTICKKEKLLVYLLLNLIPSFGRRLKYELAFKLTSII